MVQHRWCSQGGRMGELGRDEVKLEGGHLNTIPSIDIQWVPVRTFIKDLKINQWFLLQHGHCFFLLKIERAFFKPLKRKQKHDLVATLGPVYGSLTPIKSMAIAGSDLIPVNLLLLGLSVDRSKFRWHSQRSYSVHPSFHFTYSTVHLPQLSITWISLTQWWYLPGPLCEIESLWHCHPR